MFRTDSLWATLAQFWWFTTIIWKSIHTIQFQLVVYTCWVSVQKWFAFEQCWPNFSPLVARKIHVKCVKMVVSDRYLKTYLNNPIQTWCVRLLGKCSELICFWAMLAKFWPSRGQKITENCGFWPLSGKVFMQSNSNLVCTHIRWVYRNDLLFLAMLAKFWPSSGDKMTENDGFQPLFEKVVMQSTSKVVCTLIGWVFRIDLLFDHVGQILAL